MKYRKFGPTGHDVSVIGMGTWNIEQGSRREAVAALRHGLDLGINHIDTAEMYGSGKAEEIVAEAIAGRRDEAFIVSKVLPTNATKAGTIRACEQSLKRLRIEQLDCYILHWPSSHPLRGTIEAFQTLREQGKIASFGVSNFDEGELDEALALAGENALACNQVLYHLKQRGCEHSIAPWCAAHNAALVAYSPFGQSAFPGSNSALGKLLVDIGREHDAGPREVALAFLLRDPNVFVIPKTSSVAHMAQNAKSDEITLSSAQIERIEQAAPLGRKPRSLPTA